MVTYIYTAKNTETGEMVKAEVQAESQIAAAKLLMSQNLFPIDIKDKDKSGRFDNIPLLNRVSSREPDFK
jgi:type II secretory pathway component PulF